VAPAATFGLVAAGAMAVLSQPLGCRAYRRTPWGTAGESVAALQTLTPHLAAAMMPVAGIAVARRRRRLAATALAVGVGGASLTVPLLRRRSTAAPPDSVGTRVATVNLLYTNSDTAAIADDLLVRDIDVIAFTEFTAEHRRVLSAHPLADRFVYRNDRDGPRAMGVAVWSRLALDVRPPPSTVNNSIDATVIARDAPFRLLTVHTPTPFDDLDGWIDDLDVIRKSASESGDPTIVIGDLNATSWHPVIRAMRNDGFADALVAVGRPFTASWPVGSFVPPFAQLDHALVSRGLHVIDATNFPVPGSDHRGLVVTVASAR
jgi:endonuclease/exonuclease/phosphatase (EEP) superfamily protein YafD